MTDFLDGELGDFDWGPNRRTPFAGRFRALKRLVRSCRPSSGARSGLLPVVLMVAVGSATLAIGAASAWASYFT